MKSTYSHLAELHDKLRMKRPFSLKICYLQSNKSNIMTTSTDQGTQLSISQLPIFKSELISGHELRVLGTHDDPLFIAKDVAKMLDYKDTKKAIEAHVDNEDKISWKEVQKSKGGESPPSNYTLKPG